MRYPQGFTLIELLITISVLAIVLGIAIPSFSTMLRENRSLALSSELQGALQYARSEAVKRRMSVLICRRNAAGTACENGTAWEGGWLVQQSGGDVLKVWDSATGMAVTGPNTGVTFRSNGMAAANNFSVSLSGCTGQQRRTITVSATGTTTLTKANCL